MLTDLLLIFSVPPPTSIIDIANSMRDCGPLQFGRVPPGALDECAPWAVHLRPEMIIGVNLDTLYCAAFRAHEGAKARLAALGRNISHHFHPPAALLAGRV